jgi:hypothetical protein
LADGTTTADKTELEMKGAKNKATVCSFVFGFLLIPHLYHVPHFGVARRRLRRSAEISLTCQTVRPPARAPFLNIYISYNSAQVTPLVSVRVSVRVRVRVRTVPGACAHPSTG